MRRARPTATVRRKRWILALGAAGLALLLALAGVVAHRQAQRVRALSLIQAARAGDVAQVRTILLWNPAQLNEAVERDDVTLPDQSQPMRLNVTPLAIAVAAGQTAVVRELLARGADPNGKIGFDRVPLHLAPNAELGTALLAAGAGVDPVDAAGLTPLHHAARRGDAALVRVLVAAKARVRQPAGDGQTALHFAAAAGHRDAVAALLATGADPNAESQAGWTPLFKTTDPQIVGQLLAAGAKVYLIANGTTALHEAASGAVATALLAAGAQLNVRDSIGGTPLHEAVTRGRDDVAQVLLAAGAGPNLRDQQGQTVLDRAEARGATPALRELLRAHGARRGADLKDAE